MINFQGLIFLLFSLGLFYSGLFFYNLSFIFAGAYFLIYFLIYWLYFKRNVSLLKIDFEREFEMKKAPVNGEIKYKIKIPADFPFHFKLKDSFPPQIIVKKFEKKKNSKKLYEFEYTLSCPQRGFFQIGPLEMEIFDNLNFFSFKKTLRKFDYVLFYLTVAQGKKLDIYLRKRFSEITQGLRRSWYRGAGTNFLELREYLPGDDLRLVDWKATARTGKLFVKEYEEEKKKRILILIDVSKRMFGGEKAPIMDSVIKTVMVLGYIVLSKGDYLGCLTFSYEIKSFIKFDFSKRQYERLINLLSTISPSKESDLNEALKGVKKIFKKTSLLILFSILEKDSDVEIIKKFKAKGYFPIVVFPFEPWFSFEKKENGLEKFVFSSLKEKFYQDVEKIKTNLQRAQIPLVLVGPQDFEEKTIKQFIRTLNKNLERIS